MFLIYSVKKIDISGVFDIFGQYSDISDCFYILCRNFGLCICDLVCLIKLIKIHKCKNILYFNYINKRLKI